MSKFEIEKEIVTFDNEPIPKIIIDNEKKKFAETFLDQIIQHISVRQYRNKTDKAVLKLEVSNKLKRVLR